MKPLHLRTVATGPYSSVNASFPSSAPQQYSGYFQINRTYAAEMFFFYFSARSAHRSKLPLVVWMTGGPGCSSELAVFYENGPFKITEDLQLRENDDPRDRVYDEKVVAADMLDFMLAFYQKFPEYAGRELYITGESYGGHYVPAVSAGILAHNRKQNNASPLINLEGFAIGNGLTDPLKQYSLYADFSASKGLIDEALRSSINTIFPVCGFLIRACNSLSWSPLCYFALLVCQQTVVGPIQLAAGNFNVYDVRKECIGPLCYDFSRLDDYLAQPSVREALGVDDRSWQSCSPDVYQDMSSDIMKNYGGLVEPQLEAGMRVMIYAGVEDWICNWLGNRKWLLEMAWSQQAEFVAAPERNWTVDGRVAGSVQAHGPLSFVKVYGAGHMVPMDAGRSALAMLQSFLRDEPLAPAARKPAPVAGVSVS
ncbi:hypothetical protein WJX81_007216 [Elliptochloris bilobata]|uniref:Carboxypeptidase n=1 Tax=Elliptochloris bilobata TaxID=381761 RepID=A0AAW1RNU8_9CHLO